MSHLLVPQQLTTTVWQDGHIHRNQWHCLILRVFYWTWTITVARNQTGRSVVIHCNRTIGCTSCFLTFIDNRMWMKCHGLLYPLHLLLNRPIIHNWSVLCILLSKSIATEHQVAQVVFDFHRQQNVNEMPWFAVSPSSFTQ